MESDIQLVDLHKQSLKVVKESIKIAESLGAANFRFYVNPTYIRNGLVVTSIVKLIGEVPPATQYLIDFAGLKNLKATVDFAKKVLIDDGEANVEEKDMPSLLTPAVTAPVKDSSDTEDVATVTEEPPIPKRRGRKKVTAETDDSSESESSEAEESE